MSKAAQSWQCIHQEIDGSQQDFINQLQNIESVQKAKLFQILQRNEQTQFGKKYQFQKIKSIDEFIQTIPIHSYEDCRPYIEEMAADEAAELICFEQTGGSLKGPKLIPYTEQTLKSFQNALLPWLDDLLRHRPRIKDGTAYWSISPVTREKVITAGGHSVGLTTDALYFGDSIAQDISQTLAVLPYVAEAVNIQSWQYQTLRDLLLADDLSFISVWSPTFLLDLIRSLPTMREILLADIRNKNAIRANKIEDVISAYSNEESILNTKKLWPRLDTISCWRDGVSARYIPMIQSLFPDVYIQGKGLLATEGIVTIPLTEAKAPVLTINSGFYEFLDEGDRVWLAHQLQQDQSYHVILTNDSGLYRYKLGDKVKMEGQYNGVPMLRFLGRGDLTSDLCGEKLTDDFVVQVLADFKAFGETCFLHPKTNPHPHYVLISETESADASDLLLKIDIALMKNPQYQYARDIGQLGDIVHKVVPDVMYKYSQWHQKQGRNIGDIKPPSLMTNEALIQLFYE